MLLLYLNGLKTHVANYNNIIASANKNLLSVYSFTLYYSLSLSACGAVVEYSLYPNTFQWMIFDTIWTVSINRMFHVWLLVIQHFLCTDQRVLCVLSSFKGSSRTIHRSPLGRIKCAWPLLTLSRILHIRIVCVLVLFWNSSLKWPRLMPILFSITQTRFIRMALMSEILLQSSQ